MPLSFTRVILWSSRLLSVVIALWWPAVWRDPVYTPREARLAGQELQLPDGTAATTADDQALAIFWRWEHRTLVTTRWVTGPCRGLREAEGRMQTVLAITVVWGIGSGLLFLCGRPAPASADEHRRRKGLAAFLTTPLWQFLIRSR